MAIPKLETGQIEAGSSEEITTSFPQSPFVVLVFEDGTQGTVRENATVENWQDSDLVDKINQEIGNLRGRNFDIINQLQQPTPRAKHGKVVPRRKRRKIKSNLEQEREANYSRITHKENLIDEIGRLLEENAPQSDPLNPLEFRVGNVVRIEGEPLSPEDQEWWEFVRQEAPEIWKLRQGDQDTASYKSIYDYFRARQALYYSQRGTVDDPKAYERLDLVTSVLANIPTGEFSKIKPTIEKIRDYFTREI